MSPCIYFVAHANFSWAKALFFFLPYIKPDRLFSINPEAHCNWLPHPDLRLRKSIIYLLFSHPSHLQPILLTANKKKASRVLIYYK